MHELSCPSCNAASQYDLRDHLLMCPLCSVTFHTNMETGKKEVYSDHYIVPNACDSRQIKTLIIKWLKRLHHSPGLVEKEYFVTDIVGFSIPYWIVSLEAHTTWKGLVKRKRRSQLDATPGANYLTETGQFRRNYRWAVSGRNNLFENWGMVRLHEPKEDLAVDWDGFPLDSTYSRGRIDPTLGVKKRSKNNKEDELSAYDVREFFEFKYANGLPILAIQVSEEEALRRAKSHVEQYHLQLAKIGVDILIDQETELEIAGIQLIHLPFWYVSYVYRPSSLLRHLQKSTEKHVIIEGYSGGVLKGELAIIHRDKMWVNALICLFATVIFFFLGTMAHPAFLLVSLFCLIITGTSAYIASKRKTDHETSSFFYDGSEDEAAASEDAEANVA